MHFIIVLTSLITTHEAQSPIGGGSTMTGITQAPTALNPSDDGCSSRNASGFPVGLEHQRPPLASGHSQAAHLPIPYGCGFYLTTLLAKVA